VRRASLAAPQHYVRVAFLRGVNVGGRSVSMAALTKLFVAAGFGDARTLLQSGNVLFTAVRASDEQLERMLERETETRLKIATSYFVRSASEIARIVGGNPFKAQAKDDPGHLLVYFMKEAPSSKVVEAARAAIKGREQIVVNRRDAYVFYPDGVGCSKFKLPWNGTGRNWNTVLKLLALIG
jgi:uncharacterized protein (DUF1697 family)